MVCWYGRLLPVLTGNSCLAIPSESNNYHYFWINVNQTELKQVTVFFFLLLFYFLQQRLSRRLKSSLLFFTLVQTVISTIFCCLLFRQRRVFAQYSVRSNFLVLKHGFCQNRSDCWLRQEVHEDS